MGHDSDLGNDCSSILLDHTYTYLVYANRFSGPPAYSDMTPVKSVNVSKVHCTSTCENAWQLPSHLCFVEVITALTFMDPTPLLTPFGLSTVEFPRAWLFRAFRSSSFWHVLFEFRVELSILLVKVLKPMM